MASARTVKPVEVNRAPVRRQPSCTFTAPPVEPQKLGPAPAGVTSLHIWHGAGDPIDAEVYTDRPLISGIQLTVPWSLLEPHPNDFKFSPVQTVLTNAANDEYVVLTIIPGFDSPPWALRGVAKVVSSWSYTVSIKNGQQVKPRPLPLPWDKLYLCRWFGFLGHLSKQFGSNTTLAMVDAAGPTSVSTEMSLPNWTGEGSDPLYDVDDGLKNASYAGSDLKMWMARHFTPNRYVAAWKSVFGTYRALFPHQYVSLNLIDGLPVNDSSFDGDAIIDTTLRVIAAGKAELGHGFAVQADGLGPSTSSTPPGVFVSARCGSAVTGFQTHAPSREGPLTTADLEPAFNAGVDFVQVYQSSVEDGLRSLTESHASSTYTEDVATETALETAHNSLSADAGCAPLRLTASPQQATIGTSVTLTATPEASLSPALDFTDKSFADPFGSYAFSPTIGIYRGATLIKQCSGIVASCTTTVTALPGLNTYSAAIGVLPDFGKEQTEPPPSSPLAVASAATTFDGTRSLPTN